MAKNTRAWSTENEKAFIRGLHPETLERYIDSISARKNWDDIDPVECKNFAVKCKMQHDRKLS